jgi:gas vesicle protein
MKSNGESKFPYFLLAMGIGAMAGLLFALRTGEDTRKYLRERSDEGLDYLNQQAGKLRESAEGLVKKGKEVMGGRKRGWVRTDTEAEKQAYQEENRKHSGG